LLNNSHSPGDTTKGYCGNGCAAPAYLDHTQFAATYEAAVGAPRIPSLLCDTIALELGLRSLTTHPLQPK
jgi:hypothetical protein